MPNYDAMDITITADEHTELARTHAVLDLLDVDMADAVLLFATPGELTRGGKHFECGYAHAKGIALHVIGGPEHIFHRLPGVRHYADLSAWLEAHARLAVTP